MDPSQFAKRYQYLWHVSKAPWKQLLETGLWSTQKILESFQTSYGQAWISKDGGENFTLENVATILETHRPTDWIIKRSDQPEIKIRIRNQRPLKVGLLEGLLDGMLPSEWIGAINSYVFLFPRDPSQEAFVMNEPGSQSILCLDSNILLQDIGELYWKNWRFSEINLGATLYGGIRRGQSTMRTPIGTPVETKVKEVLVMHGIPESTLRKALKNAISIGGH